MFWVYIIRNESSVNYKGFTENLEKRIIEHNTDQSRYTSGKGPWKLVYSVNYKTKKEALIEEKRLKKLNKKSIERLLETYKTDT